MVSATGQSAESHMDAEIVAQVEAILARHSNRPDALLEIYHDIQHEFGYVPEPALPIVAEALNISRAEARGVFTFYHDFRKVPAGRHVIRICRAEACQSMGSRDLEAHAGRRLGIRLGETTPDGEITLEAVYCLGNCALSPAVMVDDRLHGRMDADGFDALLEKLGRRVVA